MTLSQGQILIERYRIVNSLAQGGMGTIYRGWDLHLKKAVAIKENLEISQNAKEQFEKEANILANISHPNLPRVTDHFFIADQGQYLVMDFIEGEDLASMVSRSGPLEEQQVINWIKQICSAINYLHNQASPIIHRDIKPANIKITPDGRAVLVDFGIAKVHIAAQHTVAGAKAVTSGYSPLEQYSGKTDARSDIYALGATLYTLLTGMVLPDSTMLAIGEMKLVPPRTYNPTLDPALENVILKAIEITPEQRYQTVTEFSNALDKSGHTVITPLVQRVESPIAPTMVMSQVMEENAPAVDHFPEEKETPEKKRSLVLIAAGAIGIFVVLAVLAGAGLWLIFSNGSKTRIVSNTPSQPTIVLTNTSSTISSLATVPIPTQPVSTLPSSVVATETIVPTLAPTSEPIQQPSGPAELTLDQDYNCRGGTSTEYEIIWTFVQGTVLQIIGKSGDGWWLIRIDDDRTRRKQCWIYGGVPSGNLDSVPYSDWTGTIDTAKTPWPF